MCVLNHLTRGKTTTAHTHTHMLARAKKKKQKRNNSSDSLLIFAIRIDWSFFISFYLLFNTWISLGSTSIDCCTCIAPLLSNHLIFLSMNAWPLCDSENVCDAVFFSGKVKPKISKTNRTINQSTKSKLEIDHTSRVHRRVSYRQTLQIAKNISVNFKIRSR